MKNIQQNMIKLINKISKHEQIILSINKNAILPKVILNNKNIEIIELPHDDIFARDITPLFANIDGKNICYNFQFNAYKNSEGYTYKSFDKDKNFFVKITTKLL